MKTPAGERARMRVTYARWRLEFLAEYCIAYERQGKLRTLTAATPAALEIAIIEADRHER